MPFYLLLIFFPVRFDDLFEELDDLLIFSLVIEDHFQELRELYFPRFVFIDGIYQEFNLLSGLHEADADEKLLEFVDTDRAISLNIHGVETGFQLFALILVEIDEIGLSFFGEPLSFLYQLEIGDILLEFLFSLAFRGSRGNQLLDVFMIIDELPDSRMVYIFGQCMFAVEEF